MAYDGSTFTLFVDGEFIDSSAIAECATVSLANMPTTLELGRPNDFGYVHFEKVYFKEFDDGTGDVGEVCLNFNDNGGQSDLWHNWGVPEVDGVNKTTTHTINKQAVLFDGGNKWFRLSEDDHSGTNNCRYDTGEGDDQFVYVNDLNNVSYLGNHITHFDDGRNEFPTSGDLHWSNSNDFFQGTLNDFRFFSYALTPSLVEKVYENATFALQMPLDEPPGEQTFEDKSGSFFIATCNDLNEQSCPDSGIPGARQSGFAL